MARKKASSVAGNTKVKAFFKYLVIVFVTLSIAYLLFVNRRSVNEAIFKQTNYIKGMFSKEVKSESNKDSNVKALGGYDKDDRAELDALVGE